MTSVDVKIVPATEQDCGKIGPFLQKYFFPEEPLNASLKRIPTLEEMTFKDFIKQNLCFKAINALDHSEDNLIGIALSKEATLENKIKTSDSPKMNKIFKILTALNEKCKTWEKVNNEKHWNLVTIAVHPSYRGYKIGWKLVEESLNLARRLGYHFFAIECSSFYSAKIVTEMGFEFLGEIVYSEYLDEHKEQVFKTSEPHRSLQKFIKRL